MLFRQSFGYALAVVVPRAIALLVVIVFTRLLDTENFGLYVLIISYGEILDSVFLNWNRLGLLRFYHQCGGKGIEALVPGVLSASAAGLILGSVAAVGLVFASETTATPEFYFLVILYFIANGLMRFGLNILRAQEQLFKYVALEILRPIIGFLVAWALVQSQGASYIWLAFGLTGVTGIFALFLCWNILRSRGLASGDWGAFREMAEYALPLILIFFWVQVITLSDRFLLNLLLGSAAVGVYAASYAIAKPALEVLYNVVNLGAFPLLIKAFESDGVEGAQMMLRITISRLFFLVVPALTAIVILADPLSVILVGAAFRENAPAIIRLVALGAFFGGLKSFIFDQVFHLERKSLVQSYTLIPAAIMNIVLNLLLIPSYGVVGAAWATAMSYGLAAVLSGLCAQRYLKIHWPVVDLLWICIGAAVMGLGLHLMQHGSPRWIMVISVPMWGLVYLFICWKSGVLRTASTVSTIERGKECGD